MLNRLGFPSHVSGSSSLILFRLKASISFIADIQILFPPQSRQWLVICHCLQLSYRLLMLYDDSDLYRNRRFLFAILSEKLILCKIYLSITLFSERGNRSRALEPVFGDWDAEREDEFIDDVGMKGASIREWFNFRGEHWQRLKTMNTKTISTLFSFRLSLSHLHCQSV